MSTNDTTLDTELNWRTRPQGFTRGTVALAMQDGTAPEYPAWVDVTGRVALHRTPGGPTGRASHYRASLVVNGRAMHMRLPSERVDALKQVCVGLAELMRHDLSIGERLDRGDMSDAPRIKRVVELASK